MKLIIACLLASLPAFGSDIRTIGQKKVDLQPVHDWKAAKAASGSDNKAAKALGERPLNHWKDLTVVEYVKSLGHSVVVVKLDGGPTQTIMLRNCPAGLVEKLIRRQSIVEQLKSARVHADIAKKKQDRMFADDAKIEEAHIAAGGHSGDPRHISQPKMDARIAVSHNQEDTEREVKRLTKELNGVNEAIGADDKLLSIATGQSYATFPVWDTGITAR